MLRRAVSPVLLLALLLTLQPRAAGAVKPKDLPERWRVWLEEEVYPLITSEQRKAFLALETDAQRKEYAERLWTLWGSQTGMGTAFRRTWDERVEQARADFDNTIEDRARVLLLQGPPDVRIPVDCEDMFYPLEFWQWSYIPGFGQEVTVLFYKPFGIGNFHLWDPFETRWVLYTPQGESALKSWAGGQWSQYQIFRPEYRCAGGADVVKLIATAEFWSKDPKLKMAMSHLMETLKSDGEGGSARFLGFTTIVPKGSEPLEFDVTPRVAGREGSRLAVILSANVPRAVLGTAKVGEMEVVQLDVTGEISQGGDIVDRFRYAFTFPSASEVLPVVAERRLRPGRYHLRLKVADANSKHAAVREADFQVDPPPPDALGREDQAEVDKSLEAARGEVGKMLSLQGPSGEGVSGVQRFVALAGPEVARVEFLLDGKPILTKNRPPFDVDLDLGPVPRLATVTAVAYGGGGKELDRRQLDVNVGRERFMVRLQPISEADRDASRVRAQVAVNVPPEHTLARVELYWNENKVLTLYQPPFDAWVQVEDPGALGYLRALAVLEDGAQAEDVQFVNAPQFLSGVQVDAVELPVVVLDRHGKPVEGLERKDFKVFENDVPQEISHFALQRELPVRLGLVLDTSGSMEETLPEVQRVVLGFLRTLLQPRDRAFVEAFSDRPTLIEGFTADFGALERALISLRADRETAFYDGVVYGLFQFSGVRGRKALIVLTDGKDNVSRLDFDRALSYAQRSGVSIYTIGIDLPITEIRTRSQLNRLARMTGGASFFLPRDAKLESVYEQIDRELRTQYLIAYTSSSAEGPDVFRQVRVEVEGKGLEVRTLAGYYPSK